MRSLPKLIVALAAALVATTALAQTGNELAPEKPVLEEKQELPIPSNELTPLNVEGVVDLGGSSGKSREPSLQTRQFGLRIALGCEVAGTPSAFPDDLYLVNESNDVLRAGANIKWQVKGVGLRGYVSLNADLAPGAGFRADGVLGGGVEAGSACSARAI